MGKKGLEDSTLLPDTRRAVVDQSIGEPFTFTHLSLFQNGKYLTFSNLEREGPSLSKLVRFGA